MSEVTLRKGSAIDEDVIDGDLILMNLDTRQVTILNAAARVLWDVVDEFPTRGELLTMLRDALPDRPGAEVEQGLDEVIGTLTAQGFLAAA
jgi:coenzyme PQQ synthesis protein D (PqqD)